MKQMQMLLLNDIEKGYITGLFDGEGYISINKVQKRAYRNSVAYGRKYTTYRLHVRLGSTNREVLEWLLDMVGGYIYDHNVDPSTGMPRGNRKESWTWHIGGRVTRPFLELIQPFCKIKRPQVDLALAFLDLGSEYCPETRFEFYEQMLKLNQRGAVDRLSETTGEDP